MNRVKLVVACAKLSVQKYVCNQHSLFYMQTFLDMEGSGFGDLEGVRVSDRNAGSLILQVVSM